ncbi:serine/arginine repetitive matrix protein 2 [Streptomyces sp. ME19-01-6]|uniref:serine/arginine repetitive matrix protein 2 n=1 Tax=Streptomyces sp. ME19-01-6 TaxID=3028686 RepID=UPI0029A24E9C|nr:serine/arginine repetitive matrix protein 2 [Streptomyces sp. ME19-01-6]MDX3227471.1 serine/arginine repetitive matrix protein 2 [Streptomyces sp. ME19-01-6]
MSDADGERPEWMDGGGVPVPPSVGDARRGLRVAAVAVVLCGALAFAGWVAFGSDGEAGYRAGPVPGAGESALPGPSDTDGSSPDDASPVPGQESGAPSASPSAGPSEPPSGSPEESPSLSPSAGPSASPPAGFRAEEDPAGFTLAVPDGWRRTVEGPSVFYTSSDQATMVQIFELHGPEGTPYESAQEAERLAARQRGYERIALERIGQGAMDPAGLEYTYDSEKYGGSRRVLDHRFTASDGTMYAILVIGPAGDRAGQQEIQQAAVDSFRLS